MKYVWNMERPASFKDLTDACEYNSKTLYTCIIHIILFCFHCRFLFYLFFYLFISFLLYFFSVVNSVKST